MNLPDSSILTNIKIPGRTRPLDILFEKTYINTRGLENRLYKDEEVIRLPGIAEDHTHYQEWRIRARMAARLIHHLKARKKDLDILEIGCGNGWLSHQLAEISGAQVTGLDINFTELQQAARVFNDDPNLHFIRGDIRTGILGDLQFDCIVLADTLQYFPSLKKIVHLSLAYLKEGGEIHIMDTCLDRPEVMEAARRSTLSYYTSLGYPEMADFIYHHSIHDLRPFHAKLLYNPHSLWNRLGGKKVVHPWVRIKR